MWQSTPDNLPVVPDASPADADFRKLWKLEVSAATNHSFKGWDGRTETVQSSRRMSVSTTTGMSHYVLYTPVAYDFFRSEPVDHAINTRNLPGLPQDHGLAILGTGQNLQRSYQLTMS